MSIFDDAVLEKVAERVLEELDIPAMVASSKAKIEKELIAGLVAAIKDYNFYGVVDDVINNSTVDKELGKIFIAAIKGIAK